MFRGNNRRSFLIAGSSHTIVVGPMTEIVMISKRSRRKDLACDPITQTNWCNKRIIQVNKPFPFLNSISRTIRLSKDWLQLVKLIGFEAMFFNSGARVSLCALRKSFLSRYHFFHLDGQFILRLSMKAIVSSVRRRRRVLEHVSLELALSYWWMNFLLLLRQSTNAWSSFNQSAITSTATTIPLYLHRAKVNYRRRPTRASTKSQSTGLLTRPHRMEDALSPAHNDRRFEERPSVDALAYQYLQEPAGSCNMKSFPSFNQIIESKRRQLLYRRILFTFLCLLVMILSVIITILLIIRFSWTQTSDNPFCCYA